eukprot:scaffold268855_cov55-Attheya_sp.AAC.2
MDTRGLIILPNLGSESNLTSTPLQETTNGDSLTQTPMERSALADSALEVGVGIIQGPTYDLADLTPLGLFRNGCATSEIDTGDKPVGQVYTSPYIEGSTKSTCNVDPNGASGSDTIGAIVATCDASHFTPNEPRESTVLEPRAIVQPLLVLGKDMNNEEASTNDDGEAQQNALILQVNNSSTIPSLSSATLLPSSKSTEETNDDGYDIDAILNAAKDAEGEQDFDEENEVPEGSATTTTPIPIAMNAPFAAVLMT